MKKPRLPTPEELAEWRATNRGTKRAQRSNPLQHTSEIAGGLAVARKSASPLPSEERARATQWEGEGAATQRDLSQSPLKPLPTREAKRAFKSYGTVDITLDLHGLTKPDAYRRVQQCLTRAYATGRRHVAIITGKGRAGEAGVLRSNLPYWLNESGLRPLIAAFAYAHAKKGGEGVMHVLLKRSL